MNAIPNISKYLILITPFVTNFITLRGQYYNGTYVNSMNQELVISNCVRGKSFEYVVSWGFESEGWEQNPEGVSCFIDGAGVAIINGNEARDREYDESQTESPNFTFSLKTNEICVSTSSDYVLNNMPMNCVKFGDFGGDELTCFSKVSGDGSILIKAESSSDSKYVEWGKKPSTAGTIEGPPDPWTWSHNMCDGLCGMNLSASSTLSPQGKFNYEPSNICDDNPTTAWVEGSEDYGIGEYFQVDGYVMGDGTIYILNGYQSSRTSWENNSRVKKLKISYDGIHICNVELSDKMGVQFFKLPEAAMQMMMGEEITVQSLSQLPDGVIHKTDVSGKITYSLESGGKLRFTIMEVYPGLKWKDTAISGIFSCGG